MIEKEQVRFLSPFDEAYFDWESDPTMNVYMGAIVVYEESPEPETFLSAIESAADKNRPLLRSYPISGRGIVPARWKIDQYFDLSRHVQAVDLGPDGSIEAAIKLIQDIYIRKFDPCHPLWQVVYVHGLEGSRAMMLVKLNHAYIDGRGFIARFASIMFPDSETSKTLDSEGVMTVLEMSNPAPGTILRAALGTRARRFSSRVSLIWSCAKTALCQKSARQALANQVKTYLRLLETGIIARRRRTGTRRQGRSVFVRRLELDVFRSAAHREGGGVNELLVDMASRIIRRYDYESGDSHNEIVVLVPEDARDEESRYELGNHLHLSYLSIPASIQGNLHGIRKMAAESRKDIGSMRLFIGALTDSLPHAVRKRLERIMVEVADTAATNLVVPLRVNFAGKPISEAYVLAPPMGAIATFALVTYEEHVNLGIVINDGYVDDIPRFCSILDEELERIRLLGGSGDQTP